MRVKLWGTRGSLASPGSDTLRYGGNTTCATVEGSDGTLLVLDSGTGIRNLSGSLPAIPKRVHILLTHLHMDHIEGLPFFSPIDRPGVVVNIFGPASSTISLKNRLLRYLSAPLFPVSLREMHSELNFYGLPSVSVQIGEFTITAQFVIHYNPTLGYRIQGPEGVVAFLPDHNPGLGMRRFPQDREWTSGYALAQGADLLIHDAQYSDEEYASRPGFGHSSLRLAIQFAELAGVRHLVPVHHDPTHSDDMLDDFFAATLREMRPACRTTPGQEGMVFEL